MILDKQLSNYFGPISNLPERSLQDPTTVPFLKELYAFANNQKTFQDHLDYLNKVKIYAGSEQSDNTQAILDVIENYQSLAMPERIRSLLKKMRQTCDKYLKLTSTLYAPNKHKDSAIPTILEWQFYSNQLSTATATDFLQQLVQLLQKHQRINISLRSVFLPIHEKDLLTPNFINPPRFTSINEACASLASHLNLLKDIPDAEDILEKFNGSVPLTVKNVVSSLLNGEEPTLSIEELSPESLELFQTFPGFKGVVEIRFIPKVHAK